MMLLKEMTNFDHYHLNLYLNFQPKLHWKHFYHVELYFGHSLWWQCEENFLKLFDTFLFRVFCCYDFDSLSHFVGWDNRSVLSRSHFFYQRKLFSVMWLFTQFYRVSENKIGFRIFDHSDSQKQFRGPNRF